MKIRRKLLVLVFGLVLFFAIGASVYVGGNRYLARLNDQVQQLSDLTLSVNLLRAEVNRMDTRTFDSIDLGLNAARDRLSEGFDAIGGLERLRGLGEDVSATLDTLFSVKDVVQRRIDETVTVQKDFEAAIETDMGLNPQRMTMQSASDYAFANMSPDSRHDVIILRNRYSDSLLALDQALEMQDKVIRN